MTASPTVWLGVLSILVLVVAPVGAVAQTNDGPAQSSSSPLPMPASPTEVQSPIGAAGQQARVNTGNLLRNDRLLGSLGGLRPALEARGVSLNLIETSEVFGNATGGRTTGLIYEGVLNASIDVDMEKAVGLAGGTIRISALQIHGRGLSTDYVDNLNVVSSAEATRATRLFELWYQQSFLGGKADVRVGQQSADLEFALTSYGGLFVNASFGWPTSFAVSLPAGGPAYPLAVLGARLRVQPRPDTTILLGVFNGNPAPPGDGDPQLRNAHGTSFRLDDGVFVIGEVQYAFKTPSGLAGTYKLGGWYDSQAFTNQFFTAAIGSANQLGSVARPNDNWSFYGVADQLVWRSSETKDGGVGLFARVAGAPGGRNQINVFGNAGISYKGVFGRSNDTVGLGVAWAHISETARSNDEAAAAAAPGTFFPIRSSEVALELSYQAQATPWMTVQPDFQYVVRPGGGVVNPDRLDRRIGNAAVFGVRSTIAF